MGSTTSIRTGTRLAPPLEHRARARSAARGAPPLEHRMLTTATLILIAYGAVMVYSASSPVGAISGQGYGTGEFLMYLVAAGLGLIVMRAAEWYGLRLFTARTARALLIAAFLLLLAVLVPGLGRKVNDARRWFAAGPIAFQPSELMKLALVLYLARYLADHPRRLQRGFRQALAPVALVTGPACLLIALEPDLGTALVVFLTVVTLLIAAGVPLRFIVVSVVAVAALGLVYIELHSSERARLLSFLGPMSAACAKGPCYQAAQGQIAIGSGGVFGVGLGQSVQKLMWLPEAQTDFILAVLGEELGALGICALIALYGMIAYAGLRTARRAASPSAKLLATGLTALILCQATVNIFVVLGLAPLTGVPLPFISYAPTNLVVMLCSVGLLLGIARPRGS